MTAASDKLRINWSKRENDLMIHFPLGSQTVCDGHLLASMLRDLRPELERRGYDITTLRFEISPKAGHDRFASERLVEKIGELDDRQPTS